MILIYIQNKNGRYSNGTKNKNNTKYANRNNDGKRSNYDCKVKINNAHDDSRKSKRVLIKTRTILMIIK